RERHEVLTRNTLIQRVHDLLNLIGIIQLVVGQFFIFTIHSRIFWRNFLSAMKMFEKLFDKQFALELVGFQRSNFYYKSKSVVRCKTKPEYEWTRLPPPVRAVYLWHDIKKGSW